LRPNSFATDTPFTAIRYFTSSNCNVNLNWLDREADVEENREQRGPTAFADLDRLREELNELGLRIRRPAGEQLQQERREEGAGTLVLKAK